MSSEKDIQASIIRKMNLVEAAINADAPAPRATRLGDRVMIADAFGRELAAIDVRSEALWLSTPTRTDALVRVDGLSVSAIVALIARITDDKRTT